MAILPIHLIVTETWRDITTSVELLELIEEETVEIFHDGQGLIEVIIDTLGTTTINSTYNKKGRLINGSQFLAFPYTSTTKFWVRRIESALIKESQIQLRKQVQNISGDVNAVVKDNAGRANVVGVFGEQWATDVKNDIVAQFSYGKSNYDLKPDEITGSGTVMIEESNLLTVSTGTDTNGASAVESFNSIRYRPGHTVMSHFTALWTDPSANNAHQWIGIADGLNGFAIGFEDGVLSTTRMRAGVHFHTGIDDFNGNIDMTKVDFTKLNVFRIMYGYLGAAFITFEMLEPGTNQFDTIHTIEYHNENEETHIELPYLPIKMSVENTGNNTDIQIRSGSWQGGVMGLCTTCGNRGFTYPYTVGSVNIKTAIGTTPVILAGFKNVATFQGFTNKIRAELSKFSYTPFNATEDTEVTVQLVRGVTVTGGTYVNVDSTNSIMQINDTATGFTGGRVGITMTALATTGHGVTPPQSTPSDLDTKALQLFLDPNTEYAIIAFTQDGTVSITWDVNWAELF